MKRAILYWIRLPEHTDPACEGYVGVTSKFDTRLNQHFKEESTNTHKNSHLSSAINKYGWENLIKDVLMTDEEPACYLKESELRPTVRIGWNIAPGGHRGPGRKKGSVLSQEAIEKASFTRNARKERIESGELTDDDILFLERKCERRKLTEEKHRIKKQTALKKKEERRAIKDKAKAELRKIRAQGRVLEEQPSRPICNHCKFALSKPNGKSKHGFQQWHKYCEDCAKTMYSGRFKHLQHKGNTCEKCDFVPEDRIQLDLVYKDGNKKNKKKDNLLTLCANCSRLHNKKIRTGKTSILNATVDGDIRIS